MTSSSRTIGGAREVVDEGAFRANSAQVNRVIVGDLGDKLKIIGVEGPMYWQQTPRALRLEIRKVDFSIGRTVLGTRY